MVGEVWEVAMEEGDAEDEEEPHSGEHDGHSEKKVREGGPQRNSPLHQSTAVGKIWLGIFGSAAQAELHSRAILLFCGFK